MYASEMPLDADSIMQQENNQADSSLGDIEMSFNDTDYIDACRASNAHDFITAFPNGYETDGSLPYNYFLCLTYLIANVSLSQ